MLFFTYFATLIAFSYLFTREVVAPASGANCDKRWRLYAGALNAANAIAVVVAGFLFQRWIADTSLLHLRGRLGVLPSSILCFLTASFIAYWVHRASHWSDRLWRWLHQLHHSPARIETLTAFYVHPFDAMCATVVNAATAYLILGVGPAAAALSLIYVTLFNLYAHADRHSPHWVGYFVQRPEMHRLHHERGVHRNNYGLPLWDMLFGTWRNPRASKVVCGFTPDKEQQIGAMLLLRDVDG